MIAPAAARGHDHGRWYNWSERGFDAVAAWLRARARLGARPPPRGAGADDRHDLGAHRRAVHGMLPEGPVSAARFGPADVWLLRSAAGHLRSRPCTIAAAGDQRGRRQADPDIARDAVSFIGASNGSTGNNGTVFIDLKQKPERKATPDEIIARLRPKLGKVPGINLFLQSVQDVRVGGRSSRTQYQYTLQDADLDELRDWAPRVMDRLKKDPDLERTSRVISRPRGSRCSSASIATPRPASGLTPASIDNALYDAYGQRPGRDHLWPIEPIPRRDRNQARVSSRARELERALCRRPDGRTSAAERRSLTRRSPSPRSPSIIRANSRRPRCRSTSRPVRRSVTR